MVTLGKKAAATNWKIEPGGQLSQCSKENAAAVEGSNTGTGGIAADEGSESCITL